MNDSIYRLKLGVKVTANDGNTGTVIETPYDTASGWYVKIEWDAKNITASGSSNVAVEDLTVN